MLAAQEGHVASGGLRDMIPTIARLAVAVGVDGIFMEVTPLSWWPIFSAHSAWLAASSKYTLVLLCPGGHDLLEAPRLYLHTALTM